MPVNYSTSHQKTAFIVSAITHPLLVPVLGFMVFNKFNSTSFQGHSYMIILAVYTTLVVALPASFVFALKRSGYIQSYEMENPEERKLPLLFTSATLLFNYYLMHRAQLPELFQLYFLCTCLASILALGISAFYKISLHTIGIGFMFGLGLALSYLTVADIRLYLVITSLLAGIIAFSRMILMAHTLPQIYWGFAVGFICSFAMVLFI